MTNWTILVEDYKGVRLVMDSKTQRGKMFKTMGEAKQYCKSRHINLYQFIEVTQQDYNEHQTFWMGKSLTL